MILHPNFEQLRAFADGESATRDRAAAHLTECATCRGTVSWIRATREQVRAATTRQAPNTAWPAIAQRVQRAEVVLVPARDESDSERMRFGRWAAILTVLLMLGSAAAALSARGTLQRWIAQWKHSDVPARTNPPAVATPDSSAATYTEIVVPAENSGVEIRLEAPDPALRIRLRLTDASDVAVQARGAAAAAHFRSGPGRITIARAGAGELTIEIPRHLPTLRINVDVQTWVEKRGSQLRFFAPVVDTLGSDFLIPVR